MLVGYSLLRAARWICVIDSMLAMMETPSGRHSVIRLEDLLPGNFIHLDRSETMETEQSGSWSQREVASQAKDINITFPDTCIARDKDNPVREWKRENVCIASNTHR